MKRPLISASVLFLSLAVIAAMGAYGSFSRNYAASRTVAVASVSEMYDLLASSRVKGRVLLMFTSNFILGEHVLQTPELSALERTIQHGMVRKIQYVVPDEIWTQVSWNLSQVSNYRRTQSGFVGAFEDWRVIVVPLSHFSPLPEKVILVIEPEGWSRESVERIARWVTTGWQPADLAAVVRGSTDVLRAFDRKR